MISSFFLDSIIKNVSMISHSFTLKMFLDSNKIFFDVLLHGSKSNQIKSQRAGMTMDSSSGLEVQVLFVSWFFTLCLSYL